MNLVLTENRGKHLVFVNQILASMSLPATTENANENVSVILDMDSNKIVAVVGFNSDAGTNYYDGMTENHEILYMEDYSKISGNEKYTGEIKRLISLWLLNYLTRSAVSSSSFLGVDTEAKVFQVGINVLRDKNGLLRESYDLVSQTFNQVTKSLGFH
jgi:hypothetical protein